MRKESGIEGRKAKGAQAAGRREQRGDVTIALRSLRAGLRREEKSFSFGFSLRGPEGPLFHQAK